MSLADHLRELRTRLLISLVAMAPATLVGAIYYRRITTFLVKPMCELETSSPLGGCGPLVVQGLLAPFSLAMKIALYTGIVLASPVWLYQLWRFITPGLYTRERRWSLAFLATGIPLFFVGTWVSYLVLPKAVRVLISFTPANLGNIVTYQDYLDIVLRMTVVFGLAFELPLIAVLLNLAHLLPARQLRQWWRQVIFGTFVFAAVATPTGDPFTMAALAVPMLVLFVGAYLICAWNDRRRGLTGDDLDYAALDDDQVSPLTEGTPAAEPLEPVEPAAPVDRDAT